jgi:molybdate transport system regulatory protein
MRAWKLIKTMNACFREPVVEAARGGREHGGAVLTATGRTAVRCYQQMEKRCVKAMEVEWKTLGALLK